MDELSILKAADKIEKAAFEWEKQFAKNPDYVMNSRAPLFFMTEEDTCYFEDEEGQTRRACPVHTFKPLKNIEQTIAFHSFDNENQEKKCFYLKMRYCKYCRKFFITEKDYKRLLSKGEIFQPIIKNGRYISGKEVNDLLNDDSAASFCMIDKSDYSGLKDEIIEVIAEIPIVLPSGEITYEKVSAFYSEYKNEYYLYKETISSLQEKGAVLCEIFNDSSFNGFGNSKGDGIWNDESIMHQFGYNVRSKHGLTEKQRKVILDNLIYAKIMTKRQVLDHISNMINLNSTKQDLFNARSKWKNDFQYVSGLNVDYMDQAIKADRYFARIRMK